MNERFARAAAIARVDLAHERDFALGRIAIRPSRREMVGESFREILEPRVMRVLVALARVNGEIVSRDDLTESCWDGVIVGEDAIKRCISQLRKAAEASGNAFAIETISRVGFRLKSAEPVGKFSICVLPFANMSGDPEQEYFSDGITDDVITDLSKVSALNVVSRNTAFTFKGKSIAVAQVAQQLKVSHVLEGSVRKSGQRVRITAQLIDGATDNHVWAERYDRDLNDIFALQDEISEAIVGALKLKLVPSEKRAIEARSTTNPQAYKLYLMARQYSQSGNTRHREIVVRLCTRAVEIDASYARAWSLLAINQANLVMYGGEARDNGWNAAQTALSLEPQLAEAHAACGRILTTEAKFEEAEQELETALRLGPDSYEVNFAAGRYYKLVRRFEDAIRCFERAALIVDNDFWALAMTMNLYRAIGDRESELRAARRTVDSVKKLIVSEPDNGTALSCGAAALAAMGDRMRVMEWSERALLLDPDNRNMRYNLAVALVRLGECEKAMELLDPYFATALPQSLVFAKHDCGLDPLRELPRFGEMIAEADARLASGTPNREITSPGRLPSDGLTSFAPTTAKKPLTPRTKIGSTEPHAR
jgi:adenylate cyclase